MYHFFQSYSIFYLEIVMYIMKLRPAYKDYIWGGNRLVNDFGMKSNLTPTAEAWVLSSHQDGECYIENGQFAGMSLSEMIKKSGRKILGTNCADFSFFPMLIKLIDANKTLSVQVHPSDSYALNKEGQLGKTEMWYVIDSARNSYIYYGFKQKVSKQEIRDRLNDGSITEILNKVKVKKGDCIFIKSGTVHALGPGLLIAEIQQNSNCTYRFFDYDRTDKSGNKRELHIDKALDVCELDTPKNPIIHKSTKKRLHLANCDYFVTDRVKIDGNGFVVSDTTSFLNLLIIDGSCTINGIEGKTGDSFFVPAGFGRVNISGDCTLLESRI